MKHSFPFRIGTTSYIIPDEIIPNVRFLAQQVDDIELVLFEVDDGPNNLPDPSAIHELRRLAEENDLTYTVHLPLDLRLADKEGKQHQSLTKARKVIECTLGLNPWAYVLHLDGQEELENSDAHKKELWNDQAVKALDIVSKWAGDEALLSVENLEHYPTHFWDAVLDRSKASRCIDIGHLWLGHQDPVAYLEKHIQRARVLHIHGIKGRDHKSLANVPRDELKRVFDCIIAEKYSGVITVEVFEKDEFLTSMRTINEILNHGAKEASWEQN